MSLDLEKSLALTETVVPEPTPEQAALVLRVRRMMLIAGLTTALAISAVLVAIGYRLFRSDGTAPATATHAPAVLPKGPRNLATGAARHQLVHTVDHGCVNSN